MPGRYDKWITESGVPRIPWVNLHGDGLRETFLKESR